MSHDRSENAYSYFFRIFSIFSLGFLFIACATVPLTQRKSLHIVPDSELLSLSADQYTKTLKESKLSDDPQKVQMVKKVGEKIAQATADLLKEKGLESEIQNYHWEFNLIDDPKMVNAWCMPGGKVAVYTGILPVTGNETGLAVMIKHKIAHTIAKHGNERMSQGLLTQLGGVGLSVALGTNAGITQDIFMQAYGVAAQVGVLLPYSRLQESEADHIGLVLMAKAGYDPREAVPFWERMNEKGGSRPPEFLSTHPAPESRIENIKSLIPEAMRYYRGQ